VGADEGMGVAFGGGGRGAAPAGGGGEARLFTEILSVIRRGGRNPPRLFSLGTPAEFAMTTRPALDASIDAQRLFEGFENLMPFRVRDILLVSSLYDSFILKEDGRLNELLVGESVEMNLQQIPSITQVSTGAEALALARSQPRFNLVVTNLEVGDMNAAQLAHEIKASGLDIPVVVLAYDYRELKNFVARNQHREI